MNGEVHAVDPIEVLYQNQADYCNENGCPIFIDRSCRCPRCGRDIFGAGGYAPEKARKMLVTGCPHCNASFCD